jgi:hypothetical protein
MNELFNELITEIMSLGEAKTPTKPTTGKEAEGVPSGKYIRGKFVYDAPRGGIYLGQIKKVGGQSVFFAKDEDEKEKVAATKKAQQSKQVSVRKPTRPATQQPSVDTKQTISDLEAKTTALKQPKKKAVAQELLDAMKSGDKVKIQKVIDNNGIVLGNSGRLKFTGGDKAGLADEQLSAKISAVLKGMGVTILSRGGAEADTDVTRVSAEEFKPQQIFTDEPLDQLDVEEMEDGIVVEGIEITRVDDRQAGRLEEALVKRARRVLTERGDELTPEYEQRLRSYIQRRIEATNNNINYLLEASRAGGQAYKFQGEDGAKKIADGLSRTVDQHVPEERKQSANDAVEAMRVAKTPAEFNDAYNKFMTAVRGTAVDKNMKYVAETLTALRVVAFGGIALVPISDSYQLADVISIRRSPVTGDADIQLLLSDVEEETEITAAGSVKLKKGAASVNTGKIKNSRFNTGTVDGVDASDVQSDLAAVSTREIKNTIFAGDGEEPSEEARQQVMGYIQKYGPMVKAYFGFPEDMSEEDLYESLSYGRVLECGPDGPQAPSDGIPFKEGQPGNPHSGKWRLWAALGQVTEAIHNRTVEQQYYHTIRYDRNGITVADGIRTLSKMEVQAVKGKGATGRPDSSQAAFTIPAKMEEVRDGNPCTQ